MKSIMKTVSIVYIVFACVCLLGSILYIASGSSLTYGMDVTAASGVAGLVITIASSIMAIVLSVISYKSAVGTRKGTFIIMLVLSIIAALIGCFSLIGNITATGIVSVILPLMLLVCAVGLRSDFIEY